MSKITYNGHPVETGAYDPATVRKALTWTEKEDTKEGAIRAGVAHPMVKKWASEAKIVRRNHPDHTNISFMDKPRPNGPFISYYGSRSRFTLNSKASKTLAFEEAEYVRIGMDKEASYTHFYIAFITKEEAVISDYALHKRYSGYGFHFDSRDLARDLGLYESEETRYFALTTEPLPMEGHDFYLAMLKK